MLLKNGHYQSKISSPFIIICSDPQHAQPRFNKYLLTEVNNFNNNLLIYIQQDQGFYSLDQVSLIIWKRSLNKQTKNTLDVKFDTAILNFSLVLEPATCPTFAILVNAPLSKLVPAATYLNITRAFDHFLVMPTSPGYKVS